MAKISSSPRRSPALAALWGAPIGLVGGLIGLGEAEFRLPVLVGVFGYAARLLRGTRDLGQPRGEPLRSLFSVEAVELHS